MNSLNVFHTLSDLFLQMGLPHDDKSVAEFIRLHRPLAEDILLWEAPFWTISQAEFLKSAFEEDAGWALPADELNLKLRQTKK